MDFSFFLATPHQSIFPLIVRSSVDPGCLLFVLWRVAGGGCAKIKEGAGAGAPRRKPRISKSQIPAPRLNMAREKTAPSKLKLDPKPPLFLAQESRDVGIFKQQPSQQE